MTRASLKNFHFNGLLLSEVCIAWAKKSIEEVSFMKLKRDTKCGKELTCCFKIDVRNLIDFNQKYSEVSKIFTLMGAFWAKVSIVWAKKVQRSYLSWYWRVMQNLKKNWLLAWKMTWGILEIFTRALESVKIGTLITSFCPK